VWAVFKRGGMRTMGQKKGHHNKDFLSSSHQREKPKREALRASLTGGQKLPIRRRGEGGGHSKMGKKSNPTVRRGKTDRLKEGGRKSVI